MMDDTLKPITSHCTNKDNEVNLPEVVASMKMLVVDSEQNEISASRRRSMRKRIPRVLNTENLNRRCSLKPKKRTFLEMESEEEIKEYYLDKTVKKHTNSLETIFEEKEGIKNQVTTCMSAKRFKRMIQFNAEPTDSKLKKRRDKIKKVFGSRINFSRGKKMVTMQAVIDKLNGLQNDIHLNNSNPVN